MAGVRGKSSAKAAPLLPRDSSLALALIGQVKLDASIPLSLSDPDQLLPRQTTRCQNVKVAVPRIVSSRIKMVASAS